MHLSLPSISNKLIAILLAIVLVVALGVRKKRPLLTQETIEEKIEEAFIFAELTDTTATELVNYIDMNSIQVSKDVKAKLLVLRLFDKVNVFDVESIDSLSKEAIRFGLQEKDSLALAVTYECLAVRYAIVGEHQASIDAGLKAYQYIQPRKTAENEMLKIDLFLNLAHSSLLLKKYEDAIRYAEKSLSVVHDIGIKRDRIIYLKGYLVMAYASIGQTEKAEQYTNFSIDDTSLKAAVVLQEGAGLVYANKEDYKAAFKSLQDALFYSRLLNSNDKKTLSKFSLAEVKLTKQIAELSESRLKTERKLLLGSLLLGFVIFLGLLVNLRLNKKQRMHLRRIDKLNGELNHVMDEIKIQNALLQEKNSEINNLLKTQEKSLFSRVLKISTYNDTVGKLSSYFESLIDKNQPIQDEDISYVQNVLNSLVDDTIWQDFEVQFEKIRPFFFRNLKQTASDLTVNDLKHCAYIVAKLTPKEVAKMINISHRSVETTRYRIKKKLNLVKDQNIYDYLMTI